MSLPSKVNYGDSVEILGKDIDINRLRIEFNSLEGIVTSVSAGRLVVHVPDSCGSGYLRIYYFDVNRKKYVLWKQLFNVDYQQSAYKLPKKIRMVLRDGSEYVYNVSFNDFNKIDGYDLIGLMTTDKYVRKYYYDSTNHYMISKIFGICGLCQVDSFRYDENYIIDTTYFGKENGLYAEDLAYKYTFNNENKIEEVFRLKKSANKWVTYSYMRLKYFTDSCALTYYDNGAIGETTTPNGYIIFDNMNNKQPLQPKYTFDGLDGWLIFSPGLEFLEFPGSIIYKESYSYGLECDLYYDLSGFLVKELHYSYDLSKNKKIYSHTVYTEY